MWDTLDNTFLETLKNELEINTLTSDAKAEFVTAVESVWQSYVDDGYFTQDDIDEALAIIQEK